MVVALFHCVLHLGQGKYNSSFISVRGQFYVKNKMLVSRDIHKRSLTDIFLVHLVIKQKDTEPFPSLA